MKLSQSWKHSQDWWQRKNWNKSSNEKGHNKSQFDEKGLHIFWGVRKLPWKSSFSTIYLIPHSAATYQELAEVFLTFVSLLYIMLSVHIYWRKMSFIKAHMNTNKKHANIGPSVNHCTKSYYCCNKIFWTTQHTKHYSSLLCQVNNHMR